LIQNNGTYTAATIDNSLDHDKHKFNDKKLVYYTDTGGQNHYYLKLHFQSMYMETIVSYLDLAASEAIPADFKYDNMMRFVSLPATETSVLNQTVTFINSHIDAVKINNSTSVYVLTSAGSSNNPGVSHPYLYPDTSTSWSSAYQLSTDPLIYAWKYTESI
jgi:hypothetical protein